MTTEKHLVRTYNFHAALCFLKIKEKINMERKICAKCWSMHLGLPEGVKTPGALSYKAEEGSYKANRCDLHIKTRTKI